jgi:hypothetical protein
VRFALAVVVATAALAVPTASPAAPGIACSVAAARTAIATLKPKVPSLDNGRAVVSPGQADAVICFDFTRDGRMDMAVTVASGGTAGDVAWIVFVRTATGWRVALTQGGYKVGLSRVAGDLVSSQPIYRKNDPNCCPTGGFDHARWHWNGSRFTVVRSWHNGSYKPSP